MALIDFPQTSADLPAYAALRRTLARLFASARPTGNSHEEAAATRALMREMIDRSPEAFASECDVHQMMHVYPGRF
ncbi:hypothetical protein KUW09_05895 [Mameliella alba]|nr:hypothetical protein [Antarctobacter heliothermus]MBY6143565.1 hypothetical protein [Mameliella alba]MCA0952711.1 hypothetical protein [Mameliella alba]